jgi:hypothetical protein
VRDDALDLLGRRNIDTDLELPFLPLLGVQLFAATPVAKGLGRSRR